MDVAILAGGLGTRLAGIWDGPKCLVRVGGRPVIERILERVSTLRPRRVVLLLGHKHRDVEAWLFGLENFRNLDISCAIEDDPLGTAGAMRNLLGNSLVEIEAPILVLNGDTIPLYDLGALLAAHLAGNAHVTCAWGGGRHAGAAVLSATAMQLIEASYERDLEPFLTGQLIVYTHHFGVGSDDFLDVGTPAGFQRAQFWRELQCEQTGS